RGLGSRPRPRAARDAGRDARGGRARGARRRARGRGRDGAVDAPRARAPPAPARAARPGPRARAGRHPRPHAGPPARPGPRGQEHLLGPGRVLRAAIETGELHSMILWGPPGSGKTTLASLMARVTGARFVAFSAVLSGVKEIREVIGEADRERARHGMRTILFVDEIHRFNRAQQAAFRPLVE